MMIIPIELHLHQNLKLLEVHFDNNECFSLPCEYLRVYSPSAEVRGHGSGPGKLQTGKLYVNIISIEPIGNYAVKLVFDDGHNSGIYTWDWLYQLSINYKQYWQDYLNRLTEAGASRESSSIA